MAAIAALDSLVGLCCDLSIIGLELCSDLGKLYVGRVESIAVGDDLRHIGVELSGSHVLIRS